MADPSTYRPAPGTIPDAPGVYRFRDPTGRVIYVGKAKSLRSRLNSYFADPWTLHQRTRQMVTTAASVDWITVGTEVEALQQEYTWIKQYDPRFNVRYRDDKSYPYLAVTLDEEYPRLQVMRGAKRKGVRYFGPYSHAWAIRETLDLLLRVFPARTCSAGVFKRAGQVGRPCLLGYIGKCSAPCVGTRLAPTSTGTSSTDSATSWPAAPTPWSRRLEREMAEASEQLEFERAARLRDDVAALRRAMEKQTVVLGDGTDADVVAFADDPLEAAVQVFHVRDGRVRGQRGWVVEKVEELTVGDLVHHFCTQVYGGEQRRDRRPAGAAGAGAAGRRRRAGRLAVGAPGQPGQPAGPAARRQEVPAGDGRPQRGRGAGPAQAAPRGRPHHPQQGARRDRRGARACRPRRCGSSATTCPRSRAPTWSPAWWSSRTACPARANTAGSPSGAPPTTCPRCPRCCAAGSPATSRPGRDRRAGRGDDGRPGPAGHRPDHRPTAQVRLPAAAGGGRRRSAAGRRRRGQALAELGIDDVALCGLAKRLEEVWLPDDEFPVILPRTSEALYLLQRVRDEAHRFAITYHRQRRSKRMTASAWTTCPASARYAARRCCATSARSSGCRRPASTRSSRCPGVGRRTAEAILAALNGDGGDASP